MNIFMVPVTQWLSLGLSDLGFMCGLWGESMDPPPKKKYIYIPHLYAQCSARLFKNAHLHKVIKFYLHHCQGLQNIWTWGSK